MKLILENWRNYVAEIKNENSRDYLYLFEEDSVNKVSFTERLNSLNESEGDFELFLEEWGRSVDYQLDMLTEADATDAINNITWQSMELLKKGKAGLAQVMGKLPGLSAAVKKNPGTTAVVGLTVLGAAIAGVCAAVGCDPATMADTVQQLADTGIETVVDSAESLQQAVENPEAAAEVVDEVGDQASEAVDRYLQGPGGCKAIIGGEQRPCTAEDLERMKELEQQMRDAVKQARDSAAPGPAPDAVAPDPATAKRGVKVGQKIGQVGQAIKKVVRPNR